MHPASIKLGATRRVTITLNPPTGPETHTIVPHSIEFDRTNEGEQWILIATDVVQNRPFRFKMKYVTGWQP